MDCPKDMVQMHQLDKIGGGVAIDDVYTSWEVKVCPTCGCMILEFYNATVITEKMLARIKAEGVKDIAFQVVQPDHETVLDGK